MNERIDARSANVVIALKIPVLIEQTGRRDQCDPRQKYEILARAGAREHGPSKPFRHSSDIPRESRPCDDLAKRLGDAPAGAAANGLKLFARSSRGRFSPLGPDANSRELRRLLVQCGLPISALLARGIERRLEPLLAAARRLERRLEPGFVAARLVERRLEPGLVAARLIERRLKPGLVAARRIERRLKPRLVAARRIERCLNLGPLTARCGECGI